MCVQLRQLLFKETVYLFLLLMSVASNITSTVLLEKDRSLPSLKVEKFNKGRHLRINNRTRPSVRIEPFPVTISDGKETHKKNPFVDLNLQTNESLNEHTSQLITS